MCQPSSTASLRYSLYPTSGHFAVYSKLSGEIKKFSDTQIIFKSSQRNFSDSYIVCHEISPIAPLNLYDNVYEKCRNFLEYDSKI